MEDGGDVSHNARPGKRSGRPLVQHGSSGGKGSVIPYNSVFSTIKDVTGLNKPGFLGMKDIEEYFPLWSEPVYKEIFIVYVRRYMFAGICSLVYVPWGIVC